MFEVLIGPFPILLVMDNIFKWLKAKAIRNADAKTIVNFVTSHIFHWFGVPRAIISDQGTHFCNWKMEALLMRYGVLHKVSTPYHPQTNGQAKISNRELK